MAAKKRKTTGRGKSRGSKESKVRKMKSLAKKGKAKPVKKKRR